MLDSIKIDFSDSSLGHRLCNAYWLRRAGGGGGRRPKHHHVDAGPASWKFTTSEAQVTHIRRSDRFRQWMTELFEAGRLDQYRLRR